MNHYIKIASAVALVCLVATSCDFLDRKPLDQVGSDTFYQTAEQVGTFPINYYPAVFASHGRWNMGIGSFDNGTDNQAGVSGSNVFVKDRWQVPSTGGIDFENIRNCNWFCVQVEKHLKDGVYPGEEDLAKSYLAETYVIRALLYFDKLVAYGDYPILTDYIDDTADLVGLSKRQPRNEVARFILKEIDKAIPMLKDQTPGNQRISKPVAQLLKARIALYEGTFERYHRGTGRVPGDATWPGKDKEWNKGKTFDQEAEVKFFLTEAMNAAKAAAESHFSLTASSHKIDPDAGQTSRWNPYFEMFGSNNLSKVSEVMLWREYSKKYDITHDVSQMVATGAGMGWTRGLVESFLMKNGLPIYSPASGYHGDVTVDKARTDRDERLQLFVAGETTPIRLGTGDMGTIVTPSKTGKAPFMLEVAQNRDVTGYHPRKFFSYSPDALQGGQTGAVTLRLSEAYLIYMEASYELTHRIDDTAKAYWTALRARAGITAPISVTIDATDMAYEANVNRDSYDWGAFSAGKPVDATLYSIRRERRSEFAGEGHRWDDLVRWSAMDQVTNYQIEGVNFWTEMWNWDIYWNVDKKTKVRTTSKVLADGSDKANISSKELSKYHRPYQVIKANNPFYEGYTFYPVYYLSPFSVREMELCSPTGDPAQSNLYQNPGWPITSTYPTYSK